MGITVVQHLHESEAGSDLEKYLAKSELLKTRSRLIRLDSMKEDADEARLIDGIKRLISEKPVLVQS